MGQGSRKDWRKAISPKTILVVASALFVFALFTSSTAHTFKESELGSCEGRQWSSPQEQHDCKYPDPPIGRWKAVYTKEFAETHNLPPDNISTDLSPGVDYMEMDVQPYGDKYTACLVNMLIKKPNDIAVYSRGRKSSAGPKLHAQRKLTHYIDLDEHKDKLKDIVTFGLVPRKNEYNTNRSYTIGSSFAFHAEDILDGYDYITADAGCYYILSNPSHFPDGWAFNYAKASVWGRDESLYSGPDEPGRPKGKDFYDSRISINIPQELISSIFEDMPIGGRR